MNVAGFLAGVGIFLVLVLVFFVKRIWQKAMENFLKHSAVARRGSEYHE